MATKFRVGDHVRIVNPNWLNYRGIEVITKIKDGYIWTAPEGGWATKCSITQADSGLELVRRENNQGGFMTNLRGKFVDLITKEPYKTLRKLEITNGDNLLTEEGEALFLNWLFQQHVEAFKKEVADPMVKAEKQAKKGE